MLTLVTSVVPSTTLIIAGNIHAGHHRLGFNQNHDKCGHETQNQERTRILDLCSTTDLVLKNIFVRKRISHLSTQNSGGCKTQVDYNLVQRTDQSL